MQIAQHAQQLADHAARWGTDQFNSNADLTDETVNNYLDSSRVSRDLAGNQLDRYQNVFQPQEDALVRDANTYSSDARIRQDMGAAEAEAAQGADAGRQNAIRALQSYGVDPSSGRYAALEQATNAADVASRVGAGQRARMNTENVGRQLRGQAIQVGQQYPGQALGAIRAGYEGLSGAQGAQLANTDRGIGLQRLPNDFLQTGMQLKYPPLGNSSSSSSTGTGRTQSNSQNESQGNQSSQGSSTDPSKSPSPGGGGGGAPRGGGGDGAYHGDGFSGGPSGVNGNGYVSPYRYNGNAGSGQADYDDGSGESYDDGTGTGGTIGPDYGGYSSDYDVGNYGPQVNYGGYDQGYDSYGQQDYSYDPGPQAGTGYDSMYDSYGSSEYAAGGAVDDPNATQGGFVSPELSPTGGAETDDVDAKLNANEFVIPKDVTLWKGQEFFQKLIASAREARVTGTVAKPKAAAR